MNLLIELLNTVCMFHFHRVLLFSDYSILIFIFQHSSLNSECLAAGKDGATFARCSVTLVMVLAV